MPMPFAASRALIAAPAPFVDDVLEEEDEEDNDDDEDEESEVLMLD
ncbi:MAG TPA: hypothetical protein VG962_11395 [Steroidobacteraceae bacterium]|nr:hypothetical protein [Steroidobacteraceae bacterium]